MDLPKSFFLLPPFTSVEFSLQVTVFLLGYGERGAPPKIPGETVLNFSIFYCVRWGFKYSRLHMMGNFICHFHGYFSCFGDVVVCLFDFSV